MWVGASSTGLGGCGTRLRSRKLYHSQIQKIQQWISKGRWGENYTRRCFKRGEHKDVSFRFLLLFFCKFCVTPSKNTAEDSGSVGQLRHLPQTHVWRPVPCGTNSAPRITQQIFTYLQQPFFLWYHFCSMLKSSKLLFGNTWLIQSWSVSTCISTYRTGHALIAYCWCPWKSQG